MCHIGMIYDSIECFNNDETYYISILNIWYFNPVFKKIILVLVLRMLLISLIYLIFCFNFHQILKSLSIFFKIPPRYCHKISEEISATDAVSVNLAYCTAWLGLITLGQLSKGEKILVHAGAGGVGLAALAIAKHVLCEDDATKADKKTADKTANIKQKSRRKSVYICNL